MIEIQRNIIPPEFLRVELELEPGGYWTLTYVLSPDRSVASPHANVSYGRLTLAEAADVITALLDEVDRSDRA